MELIYNHDGHEIVGRILDQDGNHTSAYIVPIIGMYDQQGFTKDQIKELDDEDDRPF